VDCEFHLIGADEDGDCVVAEAGRSLVGMAAIGWVLSVRTRVDCRMRLRSAHG